MQIIPVLDRILVQPIEEPDISKGGIYLVQDNKEKPSEGKVIAVGPGRVDPVTKVRKPLGISVGEIVLYKGKYTGVPLEHDGQKYLMMKEEDVLGIREQ